MTEILPKSTWVRKLDALSRYASSRVVFGACIVLVAVGAFGLGRLTALREVKLPLQIYAPESSVLATPTPKSPNNSVGTLVSSDIHNFVASKNGSKYYPAGCTGASRIKKENEMWFETAAAAQAAGYALAAGCTK